MSRKVVKPKRPARLWSAETAAEIHGNNPVKRKKRPARKRTDPLTNKEKWAVDREAIVLLDTQLKRAEADKRILLDENLKLQSSALDWRDRYIDGLKLINDSKVMLDALCRALEINSDGFEVLYASNNRIGADRDTLKAQIESHNRIIAERDALANENKSLIEHRDGLTKDLLCKIEDFKDLDTENQLLAKRNQELEAELKQRVEWIERDLGKAERTERRNLPPIETKCQMEIEKW